MALTKRRYPKEEFASRGDSIYQTQILPNLTRKDAGRFVAIDIETNEFEIDDDEMTAGDRLRDRVPDSQIWMVRVGSLFVHRFGGRDLRGTP